MCFYQQDAPVGSLVAALATVKEAGGLKADLMLQ
jgi:hypothetical protein